MAVLTAVLTVAMKVVTKADKLVVSMASSKAVKKVASMAAQMVVSMDELKVDKMVAQWAVLTVVMKAVTKAC